MAFGRGGGGNESKTAHLKTLDRVTICLFYMYTELWQKHTHTDNIRQTVTAICVCLRTLLPLVVSSF